MNKTMKIRMLSLLLCFVMLIGMLPAPVVSAIAAETVASGVSESAAWSLDSNGLFVIDGGAMADYAAAADRPWHAYAEQIKKVEIGNGVTRVGDYAFAGCTNLTEVEIGNSVNTIGAYSFEDTASLTEVVMPKNVKVFCDGMFHNSGLKKLYIYSRYTEFEGFYSVGYDEDNVLPLDTVVYCYASTHAYFYFNRPTVVLMDDPVMDVDNGDSTIAMNPHQSNFVRDLWTAAETQDGLVFDYNLSMTTADVLRVHNEMVAQNKMIGPDYNNDGKLAVEVQISLRNTVEELAWIRAGADYSFFAYNLENEANDNYNIWNGWSNEEQFITVTGDADSVAVDINATMQELEDYAGEPVSEIFVYVSVKGISYKYNGRYESADKTTTVESNSVSIYDAHLRESEVPLEGMMTPDKNITALYHVDKNGSAELVDITADTGNNTLTFTGTSFSPYVLVEVLQYYGRQQLATLPNSTALLYAYDQLAAGVETSAENIAVYNGTDAITQAEFEMVMDAYRRDYAHHFWLGNSYQILSDATSVVSILPTYIMAGTDLEAAKTALEQKVTDILSGITSTMSEYEKELYLHDRLAERITYAEAANAHNAYGALVDGKAVCEGYAEALQYLLQRVGIQSFLAVGAGINPVTNATENHEWNYVKIDGKYYHVDLTWDDQGEKLFHAYFNQTDALMQEDHVIATTGYGLPVCNSTTAQYFTGKDEYLQSYTAAEVGQLLKDNALKVHVYIPGSVNSFISWYQTNIVQIGTEAGVTGGFSYGYTKLGREVVIYLKPDHVHTCTWGDWSDNKDGTHTGSCSCGATQTQNCTYDNGTVTAPTCTAQGYTTYTCTLCGGSYVADLQDALDHSYVNGFCTGCGQFGAAAGETVRLRADQNATELTIPAGVTLDLNGYCLKAETLVSFGDIIDTAGTGSLVVGDFVLSDNSYLPVFDSENGCYRFFAYSLEALGVRAGEGTAVFGFALNFADPAAYTLLTRTQDPKLNITTELAWGNETLTFAFSPELIRQFAALQLRYPELQAALQLKVTGLESLDTPLTVTSELAAVDGQITKKTNSIEH